MKEEAWECYEEALQCDSLRERKRLLNEAIQFDPDFLDAKSELASLCTNADTRMKKLRELQTEEEVPFTAYGKQDHIFACVIGSFLNLSDVDSCGWR